MDHMNVGNMNGYYGRQYTADDLQHFSQVNHQNAMMGIIGPGGMADTGYADAQTLEDIMSHNNKEFQRRRDSQQYSYGVPRLPQDPDLRRSSMLEFNSGTANNLDGFQFDPPPMHTSPTSHPHGGGIVQRRLESRRTQRRESIESIGINTQFQDLTSGFGTMTQSPVYHQGLNPAESMGMDLTGGYMPVSLPIGMDYAASGLDQGQGADLSSMNLYSQGNFTSSLTTSPVHQQMPHPLRGPNQDRGGGRLNNGAEQDLMEKLPNMHMSDAMHTMKSSMPQTNGLSDPTVCSAIMQDVQDLKENIEPQNITSNLVSPVKSYSSFVTGEPVASTSPPSNLPQYRNAYSSSGFDMLGVLMRVAARPKPQINIGAVDMSCAFVVCDITQHDLPIVYCSDIFERLTGYTKHEILGRNCRFLQAPDGKVMSGVKRKYVDDQAVLHLKNMINQRQEAQISLINYRKGGQPFMNLLTMIPITYNGEEMKYYVGFQVDLVEQPTSITNKNPDGSYAINYQRGGLLPRYVFNTPESSNHRDSEMSQTIGRDEVSTVLSTIGTGESELSRRIWDKVLLENTDDVVHVLSLKGLFLYLSPSSRRILEYEPHELVGTALSSVCHPSDIVPVTRELKDTSTGAAVNVVFRIRRKHSGYTWFESHGSLHTEQGKGKKCIILVGRERPVYALARSDIASVGGIGESELWTKMSTSGMFLFVSSNAKNLLDRLSEELVGTSAQALMRTESKLEFGRMLERARTGLRANFKHDVHNKRGQTLHAQTTIYPGDAEEGQKPTFLVAQIRILKMSRSASVANKLDSVQTGNHDPKSVGSNTPSSNGTRESKSNNTPQSSPSKVCDNTVLTQPGSGGLAIGNQDEALASQDNVFDELKTTRSTSWQFELRQMEKRNRLLAEELQSLLASKKKRKRRKGAGQLQKDCANCHTQSTPEWRRGPSGNRDLCNSCGLRWAKQNGRASPRTTSSQHSDYQSASPTTTSPILPSESQNGFSPEKRSPQAQNTDSHNAKTSRMEAVATHGYAGGIPSKIEEGDEPGEARGSMIGLYE
ncbi:blue light receptor [Lambiella insularis]|nr:blue light receptor [Lambiella insularis]